MVAISLVSVWFRFVIFLKVASLVCVTVGSGEPERCGNRGRLGAPAPSPAAAAALGRRRPGERSPVSPGVRLTRDRRCRTHGGRNEDTVGADDVGDVRLRFSGLRIPTSL